MTLPKKANRIYIFKILFFITNVYWCRGGGGGPIGSNSRGRKQKILALGWGGTKWAKICTRANNKLWVPG